ncbi:glycosyltransferase family 2 protein [Aureliella helgolandensis]|uniref:Undecaprenyl-phosphate 4-deoxy-4-formamido-L-arabinose transferase n=1 Tax=Aureliella helgolandensis TaxID=2527968 RepID=A0A518GF08_9BACT|nr:glycosyltransferase family 2 protein [Aureliella helgolandensis]QDV27186.1 Undecaprenyl-phosphate 4-deoxy-4-formamido-L-arabinose transferase [Aureliella helgolandensis]
MNSDSPTAKVSIVVPVYNEQDSLAELVKRIADVARTHPLNYEILMVDDGSQDDSWKTIEKLAQEHAEVRGLKLRRNFGKAAALAAGFENSTSDLIITMDADLQDDPQEIPNLLAKLDEGFDVVSGWKKVRHDPWHKVFPSRLFNGLISWLTQVHLHDHNCGLKAYRRGVMDEVYLYGEMHRFVPVLAAARGFRVSEIVVQHHAREHGQSKYGFERFIKGFLDLLTVYFLTGYGNRPQHMLGTAGLFSFLGGATGLVLLTLLWIVTRVTPLEEIHLHSKAIFYYCIVALLLGVQLISIGFLAELFTAQNRPTHRPYSLAKDTRDSQSSDSEEGLAE